MEPTLAEGDEQGYVYSYSYATVRGAVEWRDHQIAVLEERNAFLEQRNAALVATINRLMQPGAAL
jgi:cell division protein FtsB